MSTIGEVKLKKNRVLKELSRMRGENSSCLDSYLQYAKDCTIRDLCFNYIPSSNICTHDQSVKLAELILTEYFGMDESLNIDKISNIIESIKQHIGDNQLEPIEIQICNFTDDYISFGEIVFNLLPPITVISHTIGSAIPNKVNYITMDNKAIGEAVDTIMELNPELKFINPRCLTNISIPKNYWADETKTEIKCTKDNLTIKLNTKG